MPSIKNSYNSMMMEESPVHSKLYGQSNREFEDGEHRQRNVVYSKRRQTINDRPVYTINKDDEEPPICNDLFNLKVNVPKIKMSKYFKEKYSTGNLHRNVLKINDSQFLSNNIKNDNVSE
jgi:hypothetical protein